MDPPRKKFVFILTPANCGSSVLASLLDSSPQTTFVPQRKYEGVTTINPHPLGGKKNWYNENYCRTHALFKGLCSRWDKDKTIFCDKYPPYMCRAQKLERYFSKKGDVYFICSIRHPFASNTPDHMGIKTIRYLKKNLRGLKNVHFLRHEDLLERPNHELQRILKFIPELQSLNTSLIETVHGKGKNRKGIRTNLQTYQKPSKHEKNVLLRTGSNTMKALGYTSSHPFVRKRYNLDNLYT